MTKPTPNEILTALKDKEDKAFAAFMIHPTEDNWIRWTKACDELYLTVVSLSTTKSTSKRVTSS